MTIEEYFDISTEMLQKTLSLFVERTSIPEDFTKCWLWVGNRTPRGYGIIPLGRKEHKTYAHRFIYTMFFGIPTDDMVLHKCDNPNCVNPLHLEVGNQYINMRDCYSKGRGRNQWGKPIYRHHPR